MEHLMHLFTAVVLIASGLAGIAISASRPLWVKVSALVLAALLMPTAYASLVDLLGKPKPVTMEWARGAAPAATVLGASVREHEAIYLWLQFDGNLEPRAYVLPWNLETAQQLQQATRQAEAKETAVRMHHPFELDPNPDEPLVYAEPQPALPPKTPAVGLSAKF